MALSLSTERLQCIWTTSDLYSSLSRGSWHRFKSCKRALPEWSRKRLLGCFRFWQNTCVSTSYGLVSPAGPMDFLSFCFQLSTHSNSSITTINIEQSQTASVAFPVSRFFYFRSFSDCFSIILGCFSIIFGCTLLQKLTSVVWIYNADDLSKIGPCQYNLWIYKSTVTHPAHHSVLCC